MRDLFAGFLNATWPRPHDPERAEREWAAWREAFGEIEDRSARDFCRRLTGARPGRVILESLFANSPFLAHCIQREPAFLATLLREGPDASLAALQARLAGPIAALRKEAALMAALRIERRRAALLIALADIAQVWDVDRVTLALSAFAEHALQLAARQQLREAARSGVLRLSDEAAPENGSGLVVIAMGKLGARELNYSSDVDLIVLYDHEAAASDQPDRLQASFVRLTRGFVRTLEERQEEGYVLRTDLRLRPDPGSTPLAISVAAAETYYESMGQNWERAAMIKARPVAGDLTAGARFLAHLRPYVWRKHLDFAAIQDIHSIKRQINDFRGGGTIGLAGHNIKLGRGGIREIEFFTQTLQLIWGGRDPSLRLAATCPALEALAAAGRIAPETARDLAEAYRFLRRLEHRLQMIDDRQTHALPADAHGLDHIATFLGHADTQGFAAALTATLRLVERRYAELFEESRPLAGPGNLVFTGGEDDPATIETLAGMGFREPGRLAASVRGWHHGRYRATRSQRAREILTELMPALLQSIARTPEPDATFLRFDQFLARLPAGVQLFSLFQANPGLVDVVAELLGTAPRLAEMLSERPDLFDAVLSARFFEPAPSRKALADELRLALDQARDYQDRLDIGRRWKREREFQVGVRMLRGLDAIDATGAALADIAECALVALQDAVEREFSRAHGDVSGGGLCQIAMGKLGGREMTVTSDLDLIFLYDAPARIEASDGERALPVSLYYTRLGTRLINAITAPTAEGRLYEIDMRLRPSGSKGPIATSLAAFEAYNRDQAWTWEHMALTRARAISGPAALRKRAEKAIRAVLTRPRDALPLAGDVTSMRARIAAEHPAHGPFDVKHRAGGLVDIEFIAQYLQLRHAAGHPGILSTGTRPALEQAIEAGLIAREQGALLLEGLRLWRSIQGLLRLSLGDGADIAQAPPALRAALARIVGAVDFAALEHTLDQTAARVRAVFDAILPARPANQER